MGYTFQAEQWLPYPVEEVFAFLADARNLPLLLPSWQRARLESVTIVPPPRKSGSLTPTQAAGIGSQITLSFRPFRFSPFRVRWEAEIAEFSWNTQFRDKQVRGPFSYWSHSHYLRSIDRAGIGVTLMVDQIEYELPLGPLGKMASGFVEKQLRAIFDFRQQRLIEILADRRQFISQREMTPRAS
jgi:ligand-binding SRPBCC domain-containing protein